MVLSVFAPTTIKLPTISSRTKEVLEDDAVLSIQAGIRRHPVNGVSVKDELWLQGVSIKNRVAMLDKSALTDILVGLRDEQRLVYQVSDLTDILLSYDIITEQISECVHVSPQVPFLPVIHCGDDTLVPYLVSETTALIKKGFLAARVRVGRCGKVITTVNEVELIRGSKADFFKKSTTAPPPWELPSDRENKVLTVLMQRLLNAKCELLWEFPTGIPVVVNFETHSIQMETPAHLCVAV